MLKNLLEKQRGKLDEIKIESSEFDETYALKQGKESGEEKKK